MKNFIKLLVLGVLFSFSVSAGIKEVFDNCDIPENLHPVSKGYLERFLNGNMKNTVFLRMYTLPNSRNMASGVCIVCNFGKDYDPDWEPYPIDCASIADYEEYSRNALRGSMRFQETDY